jgi:hypothetical protein
MKNYNKKLFCFSIDLKLLLFLLEKQFNFCIIKKLFFEELLM